MRNRLTATIAALAVAGALGAAAALAGPVTIAFFGFQNATEVESYKKVEGKNCARYWRKRKTLGVNVGAETNNCGYRSSVIGDSSGSGADFEVAADVNLAAKTPKRKRKKVYMAISTRSSNVSGYTLRLYPAARQWQLIRDPAGGGGPKVMAQGKGRFIRLGVAKRNRITLRAFGYNTGRPYVRALVNKKVVFARRDTAPKPPTGRRVELRVGGRGKSFATGAVAAFDNVVIRVPDPF